MAVDEGTIGYKGNLPLPIPVADPVLLPSTPRNGAEDGAEVRRILFYFFYSGGEIKVAAHGAGSVLLADASFAAGRPQNYIPTQIHVDLICL